MRNIFTILIISTILFGCSKDDDSGNTSSNNISGSIVGVWYWDNYSNTVTEGYIDSYGVEVVDTIWYYDEEYNDPIEEYVDFRSNNTFINYVYENDTLLDNYWTDTGDYIKNGNEITLYNQVFLCENL